MLENRFRVVSERRAIRKLAELRWTCWRCSSAALPLALEAPINSRSQAAAAQWQLQTVSTDLSNAKAGVRKKSISSR